MNVPPKNLGNKPKFNERRMIMFLLMITATVLLAVLFGAVWRDKPARQPVSEQRANRKQLPYG